MSKGEVSFILSSDPTQGALNNSSDGSYFEVALPDGGIHIPRTASECYLSVVEAQVWWVSPNITEDNNKVYISGPRNIETLTDIQLGYPTTSIQFMGGTNSISISIPTGSYISNTIVAGDIILIPSTNQSYPITSVIEQTPTSVFMKTSNPIVIPIGTTHWSRVRSDEIDQKTNVDLSLPNLNVSFSGDTNSISFNFPDNNYVPGTIVVGDVLYIPLNGQQYKITQVVEEYDYGAFFKTSTSTEFSQTHSFVRFRRTGSGVQNYEITLTPGLYDLTTLGNAIATQLESAGASADIISFSSDTATQRVQIRFPYPTSRIDFTQPNTIKDIVGFNAEVYGNYQDAPKTILAPNVAFFNTTEYFLLNTDLTNTGIRFNSTLQQTVAQVLIDVAPGSQILYRPFNPTRIPVPELIGTSRTRIRVWLTNNQNSRVNTNEEWYSMRCKLEWN